MKKTSVVVIAFGLAVSLFTLANAGNNGMGGGCGNCAQGAAVQSSVAQPSEPLRKFQADTIDLRQEMMTKRFEMQRENLKGTPDAAKVAALKAEVKAIQAKLLAIRAQSGLTDDKCDGECNQSMAGCDKKSMGGCGKGTGGCNGSPCGQK
jgi:hypothetical protein